MASKRTELAIDDLILALRQDDSENARRIAEAIERLIEAKIDDLRPTSVHQPSGDVTVESDKP